MKTGIELIAEERRHQIEDKGYNADFVKAHPEYYADGQLVRAAAYTIFGGVQFMPKNWPTPDIIGLNRKYDIDALRVAGALIAAEIDRLKNK